jgi:MscS family membrane protein
MKWLEQLTGVQAVEQLLEYSQDPKIWMTQVFLLVLATVVVNFVLMRVIDILEHYISKSRSLWDDALLEAARVPIKLLIWVVGLSMSIRVMRHVSDAVVFDYAPEARKVAFVIIGALFLTRLIRYVEKNLVNPDRMHQPMDETTAQAVGKLLRISVIITAVLIIMQTLGYSISGVLAFGGVGGIAVGFAARDMLANFFGALVVYMDQPFKVGDWVRSPDREIEGTVEDIGWRMTRIRTFDKRPLYVPNAVFTNVVVENPSRMLNRRIYEKIGIRYDDWHLMKTITDEVRDLLENHDEIDTTQTLMVNFNSYQDSYLEFFIYTFTRTREWVKFHQIKQEILLQVMEIIEKHGAEVAFPTRTLHLFREQHGEHESMDAEDEEYAEYEPTRPGRRGEAEGGDT